MAKDADARLTRMGIMAIGVLYEGDMHPYEMLRLLRRRRDDRLAPLTGGTFYHTIERLDRDGLVAQVGTDREGNRPERTTYSLTDAGRAAMRGWVRRELPQVDRLAEFRVALSEAHNLPRDEVIRLLETRRAALVEKLDRARSGLADALERRVPLQYLIEIEREVSLLSAEASWHDQIAQRLSDPTIPWGDDSPSASVH